MSTNNVAILNGLKIDTNISFDDVVNVFVSRYETDLHTRRAQIQQQIKDNVADKKKLQLRLQEAAIGWTMAMFKPMTNMGDVVVEFTWNIGDELVISAKNTIIISVSQSTKLPQGIQGPDYQGKTPAIEKDLSVLFTPPGVLIDVWKDIATQAEELKQKLVAVNGDMQGIDRKARQIKGLIAERKLQDAGMTELLANPEITAMLQLSN